MNAYEQQQSAVEILRLLDTTKQQRASFVNDIIARLDEVNPLDLHLQLKCIESISEELKSRDEYKAAILDEADKYPGKKFTHRHAEITKMEAGVKYDYIMCGDAEYDRLDAERKSLDTKIKAREAFLKTLPPAGFETVDTITGEMTTLYPPTKKSTSTISVKLQ